MLFVCFALCCLHTSCGAFCNSQLLLGRSWAALGLLALGRSWPLLVALGPLLAVLRPFLGALGQLLGPNDLESWLERLERSKMKNEKLFLFILVDGDCGPVDCLVGDDQALRRQSITLPIPSRTPTASDVPRQVYTSRPPCRFRQKMLRRLRWPWGVFRCRSGP